jgi:fibronectin type 3 domain-containing protein
MNGMKKQSFLILLISIIFINILSCSYKHETNPINEPIADKILSAINIVSTVTDITAITITWAPPSDSEFDHVEVTWTPGGITPQTVSKGTNTYSSAGLDSSLTYTFSIVAVATNGTKSAPVTVMKNRDAVPPAPIQIKTTSQVNTSLTINWEVPTDVDFNHVIVTWTPGGSSIHTVAKGTHTFTTTGLDASINYIFSLVAVDDAGNESTAVTVTKGKDTTPPDQIVVTGTNEDVFSIKIDWTDPSASDFDHVKIYWTPSGGVPSSPLNVAKNTGTYTVLGLDSALDYTVCLVSVDAQGNESAPVSVVKHRDAAPPSSLTNVSAVASDTSITITWTDPADADFHHVKISWTPTGGTPSQPASVIAGVSTFTASNLDRSVQYTFTLVAVDYAGNESTVPSAVTKYKDSTAPGIVTNVMKTDNGASVLISWTDPADTDLDHIEITWTPAGGNTPQPATVVKGVQLFALTGLVPTVDYTFSIVAVDTTGNRSAAVTTVKQGDVTAPALVTNVHVDESDVTKAVITWTDPTDVDFDHVMITWSPAGGSVAQPVSVAKGVRSFTITGLSRTLDYTFSLVTVDSYGNSSAAVTAVKHKDAVPPGKIELTGLTENDGTVIFSWTDPTDEDLDHIEVTWVTGGESPHTVVSGAGTFTATGLTDNVVYMFTIWSVDTSGNKAGYVIEATPSQLGYVNRFIYNADDLNAVRGTSTDAKYTGWTMADRYILVRDINLSAAAPSGTVYSPWIPVGTSGNPFSGAFNGNGHTVSGVYINSTSPGQGFFGQLSSAVVKNLTLSGCNIKGSVYTGGLVAYVYASNGTLISNCTVTGTVTGSSATATNIGGIVGRYGSGGATVPLIIHNCTFNGTVSSAGSYVGGIIGYLAPSSAVIVENCAFTGTVSGASYVGGITGYSSPSSSAAVPITIQNCTFSGNVTGTNLYTGGIVGYSYSYAPSTFLSCYASGTIKGVNYVGGFAGQATAPTGSTDGIIKWCATNVAVTASGMNVAGFIGSANTGFKVYECYSMGSVVGTGSGSSGLWVGGFFGFTNMWVFNCYTRCSVNSNGAEVAAFVGRTNSTIYNSYATGDVNRLSGAGSFGGFTDASVGLGIPAACYYCSVVTDVPTLSLIADNNRAIRASALDMKTQSFYPPFPYDSANSGFDFTNVWAIEPAVNDGFPYLRNNPPR